MPKPEDLKIKAREAEDARLDALEAKEEADRLRKDAEEIPRKSLDQQKTAFFKYVARAPDPLTSSWGPLKTRQAPCW